MTETLLSAVREQLLLDGNIAVLAPRRSRRHRLARPALVDWVSQGVAFARPLPSAG